MPCQQNGVCTGGNVSCHDAWCSNAEPAPCVNGHTGPFCEVCLPNHYKSSGRCIQCGGGNESLSFALPALAIAVLLVAVIVYIRPCKYRQDKKRKTSKMEERVEDATEKHSNAIEFHAKLTSGTAQAAVKALARCFPRDAIQKTGTQSRILIALIQVLSSIGQNFKIRFPVTFSSSLRWLNIFQLDVFEIVPLSCQGISSNFHALLYARTLVPLLIVGPILLLKLITLKAKSGYLRWAVERLLTVAFFLIFLVYPSTSQKIFQTIPCTTFPDAQQSQALDVDLSIDCKSSAHAAAYAYAWIMIGVYPVGVVAVYALLIYGAFGNALGKYRALERKRVNIEHDALCSIQLQRLGEGNKLKPLSSDIPEEVRAQMESLEHQGAEIVAGLPDYMKKLIDGYKPTHCGFEIVESLRKIAVVGTPVFFSPSGSAAQLIWGLMVCFITAMIYAYEQPYAATTDNSLALLCQAQIFFTLLSAIAIKALPADGDDSAIDTLLTVVMFAPMAVAAIMDIFPQDESTIEKYRQIYRRALNVVQPAAKARVEPARVSTT